MQDGSLIESQVINKFKKNPNSSISAAFRFYRKHNYYSWIGDFIILSIIISAINTAGVPLKRNKILYALNQSDEFKNESKKEKMELLEGLLRPSLAVMKQGKNA
jgi:hypothetical protein